MLVLTRKRGEVVLIGPDIKITVCGIEGGKVRLGIEAPREVTITRSPEHAPTPRPRPPAPDPVEGSAG